MSSILESFDLEANFWKINLQLNIPEEFREYKELDKSKNKEASSKIMWAIALLLEPKGSKFSNLNLKDRRDIIAKDWIGDAKFDWKTIDSLVKAYEKHSLTAAKRQVNEMRNKLDEKSDFLRTVKYSEDTYEMIEKMLASNAKLYNELARLEASLDSDEEEGIVKGGTVESLSEKGEI